MTNRPLRAWQESCLDLSRVAFDKQRRFLVVATPGAGKTTFACTFAVRLIQASLIDHVHVVTPTRPLRSHWQKDAESFGLRLGRRSNARLRHAELPFDVSGVVTTYAQIASEPDAHIAAIENKKALAILDEGHHAGDQRAWGESLKEAMDTARFVLVLSGTPFRHDDCGISFLDYNADGFAIPGFEYRYSEAIADDVCRPVMFRPYNALVQYQARGETYRYQFTDDLPERHLSETLRHALHPEAGLIEQMIRDADEELSAIRARGPRWQDAGALLVAMSQGHAIECAKVIKTITGEEPAIIISDSESAEEDLDAYKRGMGRWVVAVKMVSEGIDIPRLMIAVYATNIVKTLFFRQFVGRVVRVRHRGQEEVAHVFLPGESRLLRQASELEAEQQQFFKDAPPERFASVRAEMGRRRRIAEVVPSITNIEGTGAVYRGESFNPDELVLAEQVKHLFPLGERLSAVQVAWSLRRLRDNTSDNSGSNAA